MKKSLLVFLLFLSCAPAAWANLVVNGGFESGFSGWTSEKVEPVWPPYVTPYEGNTVVDLEYSGTGDLSGYVQQTLVTVQGETYTLTFAMGGNYYNLNGTPPPYDTKHLEVFWNGSSLGQFDYSLNHAGDTITDFTWDIHVLKVVATGSDTLTFRSINPTYAGHGAYIDAVSLERNPSLAVDVSGPGKVTSSPSGIDCGATCSAQYDNGTSVTLTAAPHQGATFSGWQGDCAGTGTCTLEMGTDKTVTATFTSVNAAAKISVAPTSVNFGKIKKGAARTKTIRIKNTGELALELGIPTIDNPQFSIVSDGCTAPVAKGQYCTMDIQFAPASYGKTKGLLGIPSNDERENKSPYLVKLIGEAPAPKIGAPNAVAMGKVPTTALPATKTIAVKNTGLSDLVISSVSVTGSAAFSQTNTCEANPVVKGAPCSITIAFDPTAAGPVTATLSIVSNDPATSTKTISLKGTGK